MSADRFSWHVGNIVWRCQRFPEETAAAISSSSTRAAAARSPADVPLSENASAPGAPRSRANSSLFKVDGTVGWDRKAAI
ncbi:hypothetical protein LCM4577_07265 [Mesorhizobium sp. LCM 4577]|nr:hypothetical protein LCM4576_01245 [Mesorhizobium sp. LCM 4576]OHV70319.1 hypothetical protein LCM4577_07265 [Mesorhizobium sp. LCM 4577]